MATCKFSAYEKILGGYDVSAASYAFAKILITRPSFETSLFRLFCLQSSLVELIKTLLPISRPYQLL